MAKEKEKELQVDDNKQEVDNKNEVTTHENLSATHDENADVSTKVDNKESDDPIYDKVVESFEYSDDSLKQIEENRKVFLSFYNKQKIIKWVVGIICLVIVVCAWVLLPNIGKDSDGKQASWVMPTMVITVALALVLTFTYSLLIKRVINRKMREYFTNYYQCVSDFTLKGKQFSNIQIQTPGKIEKIQFDENLLYKDVVDVGSRGLTDFDYNGLHLMVVEAAAQVKTDKRMLPVFVGKYLVGPASYDDANPIIIYIKGDKRALPPTNIDEIKNVLEDDKFLVYSNNANWKKVLTKDILSKIKKIKTGKQLIDVAISLHNGKIFVCLGYDDPTMVLPLEHGFDPSPMMEYKEELLEFCQLIEAFNK